MQNDEPMMVMKSKGREAARKERAQLLCARMLGERGRWGHLIAQERCAFPRDLPLRQVSVA